MFRDDPPWRRLREREATPSLPSPRSAGPALASDLGTSARARQEQKPSGGFEGTAGEARQQIASNVSRVQKARREVQNLSKVGSYASRADVCGGKR